MSCLVLNFNTNVSVVVDVALEDEDINSTFASGELAHRYAIFLCSLDVEIYDNLFELFPSSKC